MQFQLQSSYSPAGDQPAAIKQLVEGVNQKDKAQTLLGVTGSGKTFTMANVIQEIKKPTLVLTHNKTLVAQLYGEFKQFFPENAVEYFVSYYDYYQPEAYIPSSDTFIDKDLSINDEVEKLRLRTTSSLLSGRRDIVVVASVSCIFGLGNPNEFKDNIIRLSKGQILSRLTLLDALVVSLHSRSDFEPKRGTFRVRGENVEVFPAYADYGYRICFFDNEIEFLYRIEPETGEKIDELEDIAIFPANMYVSSRDTQHNMIKSIQDEMQHQIRYFEEQGRYLEAKRIQERTEFDVEMIKELGYCSGIENYSRYIDGRNPGDRPFCLIDYFPDDYLLIVDESHVTVSQVGGMSGGDRARKQNLVDYGFRLPSAMDNRPLNFAEFETMIDQAVFVSATPADYELEQSNGVVVEQIVRPTGLLDPPIEVRPTKDQINNLLGEIHKRIDFNERVLITTLTKRMAEELSKFLLQKGIKTRYIHSEVDTLERVEILRDLRLGKFDVLVGVNLLREGLDLPEVSLVAIMDADKEGFLRSERSLIQISGRAARNENGLVIMYADKITASMKKTIDITESRRAKQIEYNQEHNITPKTVKKSFEEIFKQTSILDIRKAVEEHEDAYHVEEHANEEDSALAEAIEYNWTPDKIEKEIKKIKKAMLKASKDMDFLEAARLRDEIRALEKQKADLT